ncbi:unnamed protein product [Withania somnifera]
MLPWVAHGHISPFLELAKKLADRNFQIYMCSTHINLSSIKKRVTETYSPSIEFVEFHLPSFPNLPPHYHTTNGLPPHLMNTLKKAFEMSIPNFAKILQTLNPGLVIYDFNLSAAAECASSVNIPAVQFLPFSAANIAFSIHLSYKPREKFPFPEIYLNWEFSTRRGLKRSQDVILMKTCRDFEGKYMDYLSSLVSKKIVPVSSLVQESTNKDEDKEIMLWLDKKHKGSTVFVSFGSENFLSKEQIHAVAQGLELCKVNFIWVIRFPQGERISIWDALPEGFLGRVGERGMVLEGWASQAMILQHPSIGGFVSHCGWNSVTESMKFGVPIISMPMKLDQPMNARLVECIGMGMEAVRDENRKLQSEEIAKMIRKVVMEESWEAVRKKAKELSDKMDAKGDEEIDGVVEELVALSMNK